MVKVLILKNGPVVLLSYLLNFIGKSSDKEIWILSHEHAVENVRALRYASRVVPYRAKTILEYRNLTPEQKKELKAQQFQAVYFLINPDQATGFENLLEIARQIVVPGGKVIGMTSQGEERVFSSRLLELIRKRQLLSNVLAGYVLVGLAVIAPWLLIYSLFKMHGRKGA